MVTYSFINRLIMIRVARFCDDVMAVTAVAIRLAQ